MTTRHIPLVEAVVGAIADLRMLAREAGETELQTSPALRAAQRLEIALDREANRLFLLSEETPS